MYFEQDLPSYRYLDEDYFLTRDQMAWYGACYAPGMTTTDNILLSPLQGSESYQSAASPDHHGRIRSPAR